MNWTSCMNKTLLWSKELRNFIPIILVHDMSNYEKSCINPEQRNLKGMIVRLAYNPIERILEAKNRNGAEITGFLGEAWNLVGNYLNFTTSVKTVREYNNGSEPKGPAKLALFVESKLDIIIPSDYKQTATNIIEYIPVISDCYRLYSPLSVKSDDKWIFKLITYDVLLMILAFMLFISILNFFIVKHITGYDNMNNASISLCDYLFQTFATFTNQGSLPQMYQGNWSRIMTLTRSMLAFLFITMSTAYLFSLMSKADINIPFTDLPSFLEKSHMKVIIRSSSPGWRESLAGVSPTVQSKRIEEVDRIKDMYQDIGRCHNTAMWQSDLLQNTVGHTHNCALAPSTSCLTKNRAFLAISRQFYYKRSLTIGILKVCESGLMNFVKQRWLSPPKSFTTKKYRNVSWEQVKIIFHIYLIGAMISVIFLVIERIIVLRKDNYLRKELNRQHRRKARCLKRNQKY